MSIQDSCYVGKLWQEHSLFSCQSVGSQASNFSDKPPSFCHSHTQPISSHLNVTKLLSLKLASKEWVFFCYNLGINLFEINRHHSALCVGIGHSCFVFCVLVKKINLFSFVCNIYCPFNLHCSLYSHQGDSRVGLNPWTPFL